MHVPDADKATLNLKKITHYLLVPDHSCVSVAPFGGLIRSVVHPMVVNISRMNVALNVACSI